MGQCHFTVFPPLVFFLLCKHFLLWVIPHLDKWKQIAWCSELNSSKLRCAELGAERRWKKKSQVFLFFLSDLTDPHIKYLLKSGRGRKTRFRQAASEIKASNIGSFVRSWWHGARGGSGERDSPGEQCVFSSSKAPAKRLSDKFPRPNTATPWAVQKNKQQNHLHKARCWHRLGFHAKRNHIWVKIDLGEGMPSWL